MRIIRKNDNPIEHIQIYGERCSGTNFLEKLLEFNLKQPFDYFCISWKHKFPKIPAEKTDNTLLLVIYRDPLSWLQSFSSKYWLIPQELQNVSFSEFIRGEWICQIEEGFPEIKYPLLNQKKITYKNASGTSPHFKNILKLRSAKIHAMEDLAHRHPNICYINYEALARTPQEHINNISESFGIPLKHKFKNVKNDKGRKRTLKNLFKNLSYKPKAYDAISLEDFQHIFSELDLELEHHIGYLSWAKHLQQEALVPPEGRDRLHLRSKLISI